MAKYISEIAVLGVIFYFVGHGFLETGWASAVFMILGGVALGFYKNLIIDNYKEEHNCD